MGTPPSAGKWHRSSVADRHMAVKRRQPASTSPRYRYGRSVAFAHDPKHRMVDFYRRTLGLFELIRRSPPRHMKARLKQLILTVAAFGIGGFRNPKKGGKR